MAIGMLRGVMLLCFAQIAAGRPKLDRGVSDYSCTLKCNNGDCVDLGQICDGEAQCEDSEDEICDQKSLCEKVNSIRCDGTRNCRDHGDIDEVNCTRQDYRRQKTSLPCYMPCEHGTCYFDSLDIAHCKCQDPYIGAFCSISSIETTTLRTRSSIKKDIAEYLTTACDFRCQDGPCILALQVCDKKEDCFFGDDEKSCITTPGGKDFCVDVKLHKPEVRCNGYRDCNGFGDLDELDCTLEEYRKHFPGGNVSASCKMPCVTGTCYFGSDGRARCNCSTAEVSGDFCGELTYLPTEKYVTVIKNTFINFDSGSSAYKRSLWHLLSVSFVTTIVMVTNIKLY